MVHLCILYLWWNISGFMSHHNQAQLYSFAGWPVKHGRVFLVPWKKWLFHCSVGYFTRVHWTSHFLQCTRNTRPCLTGHPVYRRTTNNVPGYRGTSNTWTCVSAVTCKKKTCPVMRVRCQHKTSHFLQDTRKRC